MRSAALDCAQLHSVALGCTQLRSASLSCARLRPRCSQRNGLLNKRVYEGMPQWVSLFMTYHLLILLVEKGNEYSGIPYLIS